MNEDCGRNSHGQKNIYSQSELSALWLLGTFWNQCPFSWWWCWGLSLRMYTVGQGLCAPRSWDYRPPGGGLLSISLTVWLHLLAPTSRQAGPPTWFQHALSQHLAVEGVGGGVEQMPQDDRTVHDGTRGQSHGISHQGVHQRVCGERAEYTNPEEQKQMVPTRETVSGRAGASNLSSSSVKEGSK